MSSLIFSLDRTSVGSVNFDSVPSESHGLTADVTTHPVESGSDITDHIRVKPEEITLTGMVSDTPISIGGAVTAESPITGQARGQTQRVSEARERLERIMRDGELVTVSTSFKDYDDMAIVSVAALRDAARGQLGEFTLNLRQIAKASTERVDAPVSDRAPRKKKGTKPTDDATTKQTEQSQSIFSRASSAIRG